MKNKLTHKYYFDEVYKVGYVFILNVSTDKQFIKILKSKYPYTYKLFKKEALNYKEVSIEKCGGRNFQLTENRQIIVVRKSEYQNNHMFYAVLAHECLHALLYTFKTHGVTYNEDDFNEPWTYYLEFLMSAPFL